MADLKDPRLMFLKAGLFVLIGVLGGVILLLRDPHWQTLVLLCLTVWAFARAYYFAFYVIEHYIDDGFRFAGLTSVIRYLLRKKR